jgi:transketolase
VILVASGSEVATLVEAANLLGNKGIRARIVSAPSEGLFRRQDTGYRHSVITPGIPVFCLTAGLPVTMLGFAGSEGKVFGLETFGFSAAYGVLDQKFGFTGENIASEVINFLQ